MMFLNNVSDANYDSVTAEGKMRTCGLADLKTGEGKTADQATDPHAGIPKTNEDS